MDVIFKHEEWILVRKTPLLLSVPGRSGPSGPDPRPSLGRLLEEHLERRVYPVHRLDYGVGGIMLFALSPRAQRIFSAAFEEGRILKTYEALTTGSGDIPPSPFENKLVRGKKRSFEAPYGKPALTLAEPTGSLQISPTETALSWQLRPLTGRPHQLRVQLAMRGFPILGDTLYGGLERAPFVGGSIALRATSLAFAFEAPEVGVTRSVYFLDNRLNPVESPGGVRPSHLH